MRVHWFLMHLILQRGRSYVEVANSYLGTKHSRYYFYAKALSAKLSNSDLVCVGQEAILHVVILPFSLKWNKGKKEKNE